MKHRILAACLTALTLVCLSVPAFAAEEPQAEPVTVNAAVPPAPAIYPAEVRAGDVDWQEVSTDYVDGDALAVRYTAVATYTGTATGRSVTGYTVTVDYTGEVSKTSCDTIVYTAVFSGVETQQAADNAEGENARRLDARLLLIPAGVAALGAAGYFGRKGYRHYINKKRGYE